MVDGFVGITIGLTGEVVVCANTSKIIGVRHDLFVYTIYMVWTIKKTQINSYSLVVGII